MARRSFKKHIQALEDAKQGAGSGLLERDDTWYVEGTTLAGSSTSTFLSALPPPPQPLFIQPPSITPRPVPVPVPEPVSVKGDDPPAKKKTQVRALHRKFNLTVPLTTLIDFRDTQEFPRLVSKTFGVPLWARGWRADCSSLPLRIWRKENDSLLWLFLLRTVLHHLLYCVTQEFTYTLGRGLGFRSRFLCSPRHCRASRQHCVSQPRPSRTSLPKSICHKPQVYNHWCQWCPPNEDSFLFMRRLSNSARSTYASKVIPCHNDAAHNRIHLSSSKTVSSPAPRRKTFSLWLHRSSLPSFWQRIPSTNSRMYQDYSWLLVYLFNSGSFTAI